MNIYWYCPPSVLRDFKDPLDNPSFRLRCWYNHIRLVRDGFNSKIVHHRNLIVDPTIVVLMSFGEEEYALAKEVSQNGGHVIHDYCENIRGIEVLEETKKLCKFFACASSYIRDEEAKIYGSKAVLIKDPIEPSPVVHNSEYSNEILKVVWCGYSSGAEQMLKPIIERSGMEYVEISKRPEATYKWDKDWQYRMAQCDIAICPHNHWSFPGKSNIKVTTAMSLNLPVIASPVRSYLDIIDNGENGYIAHTFEDWEKYLNKLKSKEIRKKITSNYNAILKEYDIEYIYKRWVNLFKNCLD